MYRGALLRSFVGLALLALVVAGVVAGRRAASASAMESAQTSVIAALTALVGAGANVIVLPPGGTPATAEQSGDLLEAFTAFEQALAGRDYTAAWAMIHPETRDDTSIDEWTDRQKEVAAAYPSARDDYGRASLLYLARTFTVVGTVLEGDRGWAYVSLDFERSGVVAFLRSGDRWCVDLHRTEEAAVAGQVGRQLRSALERSDGEPDFGEAAPYIEVANLPLAARGTRMVSATADVDRATGALVTEGRLLVALPLERADRGYGPGAADWELADMADLQVLPEGFDTRQPPPGGNDKHMEMACIRNLNELRVAMRMYCTDYDERYPLARNWSEAIEPYIRNLRVLSCPADAEPDSYAYNVILSGRPCSNVEQPCQTVVLYETEPSRPNAHGARLAPNADLADPPRHHGGNNYALANGNVAWFEQGTVTAAHFRLRGDRPALESDADREIPPSAMMMKMKMQMKMKGKMGMIPMKKSMDEPFQKAAASPIDQMMGGGV